MKLKCIWILTFVALLGLQFSWAQEKTITGNVTDEGGLPLPGVNVVVKNTATGVQTDFDGNYAITASTGQILVFSYLGLKTAERTIGASSIINMQMEEDAEALEEVVVVGYGTANKTELTGAVQQVTSEIFEQTQLPSLDQALQGNVAGVVALASSGQPGANVPIFIRGIGSLTAGTNPLYVIDGVPVNNGDFSRLSATSNVLASIDPNNVESISVLKDASAASIYGSRGANGVIIITTKSGKSGKTKVNINTEIGFGDEVETISALNSEQFVDLFSEGVLNAGFAADIEEAREIGIGFLGWDGSTDTDWINETRRNEAYIYSLNASVSGGDEKTTFFLSGSYYENEPLLKGSDFKRISGSVNLGHKITEKFSFNFKLDGSNFNQSGVPDGSAFANPMISGVLLDPTSPVFNADGSFFDDFPNIFRGPGGFNPVAIQELSFTQNSTTRFNGSISTNWNFAKNLTHKITLGADYFNINEIDFDNPLYGDGFGFNGRRNDYQTRVFNYIVTNLITYNNTFGDDHNVEVKAGHEIQEFDFYQVDAEAQNFPNNPALITSNNAATPTDVSSLKEQTTFQSFIGSASYNYKGRYFLNGTFRRDGSSLFGVESRYGNFWSVGVSWNVSEENFLADSSFLDLLKLRASYGVNGNADIARFVGQGKFEFGRVYGSSPGGAVVTPENRNLTWELNKPLNFGLDFGFLDAISGSIEYYRRTTEDLLLDAPLPLSAGFRDTLLRNIGEIENKGVEVSLNAQILNKNFKWNLGTNFSFNDSEVLSLVDDEEIAVGGSKRLGVGEEVGAWYMRGWAGVDETNGLPLWYTDETETATTSDLNSAEPYFQERSLPKINAGLTNTFEFKGLTLSALFTYAGDFSVWDRWAFVYDGDGRFGAVNVIPEALDRWTVDNPTASRPQYINGNSTGSNTNSSRYLYDGDYIRLRTLEIGYNLSAKNLKSIGLSRLRFYVKGTNIWTHKFDDDLYFDPEVASNAYDTAWEGAGVFDLTVPNMKTYSMGMNIEF